MKRILYVDGTADGTIGGSHFCLCSMLEKLDKRKFYPVVVFYENHKVADKLRSAKIESHIISRMQAVNFRNKFQKRSLFNDLVLLFLQKSLNFIFRSIYPFLCNCIFLIKHRINLIHLNNSLSLNKDWMFAAIILGVKIISHERGVAASVSKTTRLVRKKIDLSICVSYGVAHALNNQGISIDKLVVVFDGIDFSRLQITRDPVNIRADFGIRSGDPIIGVVGNIREWKGQETVIKATVILKNTWGNIRCLVVGSVTQGDRYFDRLKIIINKYGIRENVIFAGFQDNPADFFNTMDVVVHSSITPEPFGMVNIEAMGLKKPVIATNIGGPTEIFENGVDGVLVEPGDPEMLAKELTKLLSDKELREKIGKSAYNKVTRTYDLDKTVQQVEHLYERVFAK